MYAQGADQKQAALLARSLHRAENKEVCSQHAHTELEGNLQTDVTRILFVP